MYFALISATSIKEACVFLTYSKSTWYLSSSGSLASLVFLLLMDFALFFTFLSCSLLLKGRSKFLIRPGTYTSTPRIFLVLCSIAYGISSSQSKWILSYIQFKITVWLSFALTPLNVIVCSDRSANLDTSALNFSFVVDYSAGSTRDQSRFRSSSVMTTSYLNI